MLSNGNVDKCSSKAITYNKEFKLWAVKQYGEEGKTSNQIFREAGFDLNTVGKGTPKTCLRRWRRTFKMKGDDGLKAEMRGKTKGGGRPKVKWSSETERIRWLETENAYLKAENDFLAKLRAKRAE